MSFHANAEDIRVDDGHILRARLPNAEGELVDAEINLDDHIGNNNGSFQWDAQGFSQSMQNVSFSFEGEGIPVLRAELFNVEGEAIGADINISERIGNDNGSFVFGCENVFGEGKEAWWMRSSEN